MEVFLWSNLKLQDTTKSELPDTFHVESSANKLSSHCFHRLCFSPIIHWTGQIYQLSGPGHTVRIFLTWFCASFLSHWYIHVSLSKHCPYRLLPGLLCKAMAKFSSWSVSRKKSVRTHLVFYQMMVPPVPDAPSVACEKATKAIYSGHSSQSGTCLLCGLPCTEEVNSINLRDLGLWGIWHLLLLRTACCLRIYCCR